MSADIEKVGPQDGLAVQQALQHVESEKAASNSSGESPNEGDEKRGDGKDQTKQDDEDGVGGFGAYIVRRVPIHILESF